MNQSFPRLTVALAITLLLGINAFSQSYTMDASQMKWSEKRLLKKGGALELPVEIAVSGDYQVWVTYRKTDSKETSVEIFADDARLHHPLRKPPSRKHFLREYMGRIHLGAGQKVSMRLRGSAQPLELIELEKTPSSDERLTALLHSSIDYYDKLLRLPNGVYKRLLSLDGTEVSSSSIATMGIGLISTCMNHELGRDPDARRKALQSLRMLNGKSEEIQPQRDESGFFLHFFDIQTGEGKSEYSTIDTSIMMAGALFCRNTFNDAEIQHEVDELFFSIDWLCSIADQDNMLFYTKIADGKGVEDVQTEMFNEYLILAWLCDEYETLQHGTSSILPDLSDLPLLEYGNISIPTEKRKVPLSSFVIQFPFYMSEPGINDPLYFNYMASYAKADETTCRARYGVEGFWGCGAGRIPSGRYYASDFLDNPGSVVSPHIIAGFMPVYPRAVDHLLALHDRKETRLETEAGILLPRFSMEYGEWKPNSIESIDFASMLFGTAALHPDLGLDFFREGIRFTVMHPEP
jgi:hypothetical protein